MTKPCLNKDRVTYDICRTCNSYRITCPNYLANFESSLHFLLHSRGVPTSKKPNLFLNTTRPDTSLTFPKANYCNEVGGLENV